MFLTRQKPYTFLVEKYRESLLKKSVHFKNGFSFNVTRNVVPKNTSNKGKVEPHFIGFLVAEVEGEGAQQVPDQLHLNIDLLNN